MEKSLSQGYEPNYFTVLTLSTVLDFLHKSNRPNLSSLFQLDGVVRSEAHYQGSTFEKYGQKIRNYFRPVVFPVRVPQ